MPSTNPPSIATALQSTLPNLYQNNQLHLHSNHPLSKNRGRGGHSQVNILVPGFASPPCEMREATRYLLLQVLVSNLRCSFFDQSCNLLWPGDVDRVAGARDFHLVTVGSCRVPAFEVGVDSSICACHQYPAWFGSPRSRGDNSFEVVGEIGHLRPRHESSLLRGKVGRKVFMKLRVVEVRETVCGLLDRARLAEVAWEALSIIRLVLSSIGHVGSDVHQSGDRRICARFRDYGSPVAVRDKNARSVLKSEGAFGGSHIVFKRSFRFLDDADVVAVFGEDVVDAFPAGTIRPGTVNQNNIPNAMLLVPCRKRAAGQQQ